MADRCKISIRVIRTPNQIATLKAFRNATAATISEIRDSLALCNPIAVTKLYGAEHKQAEQGLMALLRELDDQSAEYEITIDDEVESREYLCNILQRWRNIGLETRMNTNLEIGEPDIETLEWLRRESPANVFYSTLQQVVDGAGYSVDSETLSWAKQQIENLSQGPDK